VTTAIVLPLIVLMVVSFAVLMRWYERSHIGDAGDRAAAEAKRRRLSEPKGKTRLIRLGFSKRALNDPRPAGAVIAGTARPLAPALAGNGAARPVASLSRERARSKGSSPSGQSSLPPLSPDATVSFAEERHSTQIDAVLDALERELVGLTAVKQRIREIAALLLVDRTRRRFGLEAPRPTLHMCFTGSPGTGKTTVGTRMAELLYRLGYLEQDQLVAVMRDDLVAEYVGQTAPMTKRVLNKAMGGVLFIDEAYHLYRPDSSTDYGQEVIEILMQVMENDRDRLVVILAGYPERMQTFFRANPGMASRVAHHLEFPDYSLDELDAIGHLMLRQSSYEMSAEAHRAMREYLAREMEHPRFANGRSVRNTLELARLRHANRLMSQPDRLWTRAELMRIEAEDIPVEAIQHGTDSARLES
jgi:probable Rubsico expression protein CbbX